MAAFEGLHAFGAYNSERVYGHTRQIHFDPPVSGVFTLHVSYFKYESGSVGGSEAQYNFYISEVNGQNFDENSPGMGSTVVLNNVSTITGSVYVINCDVKGTLMGPF